MNSELDDRMAEAWGERLRYLNYCRIADPKEHETSFKAGYKAGVAAEQERLGTFRDYSEDFADSDNGRYQHTCRNCQLIFFGHKRRSNSCKACHLKSLEATMVEKNRGSAGQVKNDAVARSLDDLITIKQIAMIRAVARERGIDADAECISMMNCRVEELSKKAASTLIDRLISIPEGSRGEKDTWPS